MVADPVEAEFPEMPELISESILLAFAEYLQNSILSAVELVQSFLLRKSFHHSRNFSIVIIDCCIFK
jgi:hypothetical protein